MLAIKVARRQRRTGQLGAAGMAVLVILMVAVAIASLAVGRYSMNVPLLLSTLQTFPQTMQTLIAGGSLPNEQIVVFKMRMPRIIGALLIGGALGMAGAAFQGMFRNPMVSPDLLGASAGAGFGAACAMLAATSTAAVVTGSAFVGGLVAVLATYTVSMIVGRGVSNITTLVLTGVVVSALFQACISITKYVADPYSQLPGITFFLMGGLSSVTWRDVATLALPILIGGIVLFALRWRINILSLDDDESRSLGMNTGRVRGIAIVCATLMTAASVAVGGMIGWVGLVIPHLMRMLFGPDYRRLLPASFIGGALYLVLMDDIARGAFAMEIPIGILTALIGAPVFIALLVHYRGGWA